MIAKIRNRNSIRGALEYDLSPGPNGEPRGTWVAGTLYGTARQMSKQAAALRSLRPEVKAPIWRAVLSLPPSDGPKTPEFWAQIAHEFLTEMGVDTRTAAWAAVHHSDKKHSHLHISLIRVLNGRGELFNRENDVKRAIKITQKMEVKHGLAQHSRDPPARAKPTLTEQEIFNRTGKPMTKMYIQNAVDTAFKRAEDAGEALTFPDLQKMLVEQGIEIAESRTKKGKLQGFSYKYNSAALPASAVGTEYGKAGLIERGLQVEEFVQVDAPAAAPAAPTPAPAAPAAAPSAWVPPTGPRPNRAPAGIRHLVSSEPISAEKLSMRPGLAAGKPAWHETAKSALARPLDPALEGVPNWVKAGILLTQALARVALEAAKFTQEMAQAIWNFIRRILALFGIRIGDEQQRQLAQPPAQPPAQAQAAIEYQPAPGANEEAAAEVVAHVAAALKTKDFQALPEVEGRAELIDQLTKATPAQALDFLDMGDSINTITPPPPPPPAKPKPAPDSVESFVSVKQAGAEYISALKKVVAAGRKQGAPADFSAGMQLSLDRARSELAEAQTAWDIYKKSHPIHSRTMDGPEKRRLATASADAEHKKQVLLAHLSDLKTRQAAHAAKPAPVVPPELRQAAQAAKAKFKTGQEQLRRRLILLVAAIQDERISARMRARIASIFDSEFATAEREGSAPALASGLEKVEEIQTQLEAEIQAQRRAAALQPAQPEEVEDEPEIQRPE